MAVEDIVLADPHVKEIIPGESWEPVDVDYSCFKEPEKMRKLVEGRIADLSAPYIIDDFVDHEKRRLWKDAFLEREGRGAYLFLDHNSLGGKISGFYTVLDYMDDQYIGGNSEKFRERLAEVKGKCAESLISYNKKSVGKKIEFVKWLKQETYGILISLEKKSSSVNAA